MMRTKGARPREGGAQGDSGMRREFGRGARVFAALTALAAAAAPAAAQDRGAVFAGGSFDEDDSGYVGAQLALPGSRPGAGWGVRGSLTGGVYSYDRDNLGIDGRFVGGAIGPVYQWSGAWGYADLGLQARYVDTHLDPYDRQNPRRGGVADAVVSIDGARRWGPWRATGYGEYGSGVQDYFVRANVTHDVIPRLRVGLETILQGDPTYDRQRAGPLVAGLVTPRDELQLSGGWSQQTGRSDHAYVALAYVRLF